MSLASQEFSDACGHVLAFGKYRGYTVAQVGSADDGLLYLDWAVDGAKGAPSSCRSAIKTYITYPPIASKIADIVG